MHYSQILLHQALLSLLEKKPLEKITVRELCAKAGVNRTTFYNHYSQPADILYELVRQYVDTLPISADEDFTAVITKLLEQMEQHLTLTRTLLKALPGAYLSECVLSHPAVEEQLFKPLSALDPHRAAAIKAFITAGSSRLISDWLLSDTRCPAGEEAEMIMALCQRLN